MPTPETIGAKKETSLADLNTIVSQQEDLLGPLTGIGNDGDQTLLTFDMDEDPPTKHAVIAAAGDALPSGSTQVCTGKVFISSTLTDCVATRPN